MNNSYMENTPTGLESKIYRTRNGIEMGNLFITNLK